MALEEALLNTSAACPDDRLSKITISGNWMVAADYPGDGASIYRGVEAFSILCQELGICIPTGKDSMSMSMKWTTKESEER